MERIGLFFGSFNPFHIGHLLCITNIYNKKLVDAICIIPAWQNPWKEHTGNYNIRCDICDAMVSEIPFAFVSDIEEKLKPQYTYEVLKYILQEHSKNKHYIIGGTDTANDISKWKNGDWILKNFPILTVGRLGFTDEDVNGIKISSTDIRDMVRNGLNPIPYINVKAYQIIIDTKIYG